jgi:hypothetical protein
MIERYIDGLIESKYELWIGHLHFIWKWMENKLERTVLVYELICTRLVP